QKVGNKVLVLDRIQDPGNLGTILRSASAFNIDTIVISDDSVDLYHPKVIRSTQGIFFNLNIIISNLEVILPVFKKTHHIIGTDVNNGIDVSQYQFPEAFALIMGNEGSGINTDFQKLCSDFIYIKMNKTCESLNVAIATSIILYEMNKR
ncbi:MAG: RNA methyltransferase, partial [Bacilli bacterium]